jgi:hypothetical protein
MEKSIKFLIKKTAILIFIFATSLSFGQTTSVVLNNNSTGLSPGDIVSIPVVFNSTANVGTWSVVLYYNRDVLTYSSVTFNLAWTGLAPGVNSNYTLPPTSPQYPNQLATKISWLTLSGSVVCSNMTAFTINFVYNGGSTSVDVINKSTTTAQSQAHFSYLKNPTTINVGTTWTNGSAAGNLATITSVAGGGNWSAGASWDLGHKPNTSNGNVIINSTSALVVDEDVNVNGDLTINSGAALTLATSKTLALTGNFLIKSDATATGSFINNGTYAGTATIQRYISAYTSATDGWRFVSSPVGNTAIGNFVPGGSDDFFRYNEVTDLWENYMVSAFGFTKGLGYLAAYAASGTKSFTGTINDGNVSFSNLTLTPIILPATPGWHLLGNPFSSSIKWNDGNWALSNVDATAKVLNGGGTYTDLGANDIIPAMQGFLVQVSSATNAITIPANARIHSAANLLNKSSVIENLKLTASSIGNNTYVESVVKTDASATNGFDADFDANFLSGLNGAPQLYTNAGNSKLSTNVLPVINNNVVMVPVSFVAGSASDYKLTADGINTFNCSSITLLDLKTNTSQDLMSNPVYNFTASASDNVNRFELYFNSTVGIGENNQAGSKIYSNNNDIYVNSTDAIKQVSIYNTIGQLIYTVNNPQGSFKYSLNGNSTGYYIVKVITDKNVNSEKVFVK